MVYEPRRGPGRPPRPAQPDADAVSAAADRALAGFADLPRLRPDEFTEEVEVEVSPSPAASSDPWAKLAAEFAPLEGERMDFGFMNRGPLALNEVDIPLDRFEPFWCRVVLPNGEPDTFSVADAKRRHFRPVPRDMLPDSAFADEKQLVGPLEGGFVRGGYCLMVRPRKIAEMEAAASNAVARGQLSACLSRFEKNVTIEGLMQSRAPEMTFNNFRGRKAVADD